jgi:hypothetical protein
VKGFVDGRRLAAAPVVNAESAGVHQAFDAGEAHGFGDINRPHDVDLKAGIDRTGHFAANQTGGMKDGIDLVLPHRLDKGGQVPHIALHNGDIRRPQLAKKKIVARRNIVEDDTFAAFKRTLGIRSPDQT